MLGTLTVCESVVTDIVARSVCENKEQCCRRGSAVLGLMGNRRHRLFHCYRPADIADQQADGACQVHRPSFEASHQQSRCGSAEQTPTTECHVYLLLEDRRCVANHAEEVTKVVSDNISIGSDKGVKLRSRDQCIAGPLGEQSQHRAN